MHNKVHLRIKFSNNQKRLAGHLLPKIFNYGIEKLVLKLGGLKLILD